MSGGRIDPQIEDYLLWHLPLSRSIQYEHCALRASLAWTVPPGASRATSSTQIKAQAQKLDAYIDPYDVDDDE